MSPTEESFRLMRTGITNIYPEQQAAELVEMVGDGLLVLYQGDLQYIDFSYDVVDTVGDYLLLTVQN